MKKRKTKMQQQQQDVGKQSKGKWVRGGGWNNHLAESGAFSRAESLRRNGKSFFSALEIFN